MHTVPGLRKAFSSCTEDATRHPIISIMHTMPKQADVRSLFSVYFQWQRGFLCQPTWLRPPGPGSSTARHASTQHLVLFSKASAESNSARVSWPSSNRSPLWAGYLLLALTPEQQAVLCPRLPCPLFHIWFLLLTRSAKWIPEKTQACCLLLEQRCAVGIEKTLFLPRLYMEKATCAAQKTPSMVNLCLLQNQEHHSEEQFSSNQLIHSWGPHNTDVGCCMSTKQPFLLSGDSFLTAKALGESRRNPMQSYTTFWLNLLPHRTQSQITLWSQ